MAKITFSRDLLQEMLFGWASNPVKVESITRSPDGTIYEIEISGQDVPDVDRVHGIINEQRNRAGERLRTLKFEPIA